MHHPDYSFRLPGHFIEMETEACKGNHLPRVTVSRWQIVSGLSVSPGLPAADLDCACRGRGETGDHPWRLVLLEQPGAIRSQGRDLKVGPISSQGMLETRRDPEEKSLPLQGSKRPK